MVKISVIVAAYNPGEDIRELLDSIDAQSMPADEFEVIFADDDSTDGSRERLQQWASARPHAQVLHNTPNSGWPGRPRNLGIDAARGEFLFFADNDDRLAPRALEWMYDYAVANDADVVIPKLRGIGPGRNVPRQLFRRNIPDAKLGKHPILAILTPHKLVRTAMVREHGIRFPEGRVRLEDHFFVVSCYFAARRISVLADRLCYFWMRRVSEGENASFAPYDPVEYYRSVERVLEVVEQHTEPGRLRDQLYAHWYEHKMLSRLRGGSLVMKVPEHREPLLREIRRLSERFGLGEAQWPWLGAGGRLRSHLVTHATLEEIRAVGAAERGVTQQWEQVEVGWTDDDRLRIGLRCRMVHHDGRPIQLVRRDGRTLWDTRDLVPGLDLPLIDITDLATAFRVHLMYTVRGDADINYVPGCTSEPVEGDVVAARAEVTVDPRTLVDLGDADDAGDASAVIDLRSRVIAAGWASERRIPVPSGVVLPPRRTVAGLRIRAYRAQGAGNLSIALTGPDAREPAGASAWASAGPVGRVRRRLRSGVGRLLRRARRLRGRLRRG